MWLQIFIFFSAAQMMAFVSHICLSLNWLQHCLHMKLQKCLGTLTFTGEGIDPEPTVPLTDASAPALMSSRVLYEPDNDAMLQKPC